MFDRLLFDRNAYDRSVASEGLSGSLYSSGDLRLRLTIAYALPMRPFTGRGDLKPGVILLTEANLEFTGEGKMEISTLAMRLPLGIKLNGNGTLISNISVRSPLYLSMSGQGDLKSTRDFVYQNLNMLMRGRGRLDTNLQMKMDVNNIHLSGQGNLNGSLSLQIPLNINMSGEGTLYLRRIGALNQNLFELDGINLQPGEEVTIDTDLLSVYFGFNQDVSSVTNDSVFFELSPGENHITIETDSGEPMTVTAIWQNRWL